MPGPTTVTRPIAPWATSRSRCGVAAATTGLTPPVSGCGRSPRPSSTTRTNRSATIDDAHRGSLICGAPLVRGSLQAATSLKGLVQTRTGKLLLLALSVAVLSATFYYLGPYFAIPAFLLFGLGVPIYLGWKIPRQLAIAGIAALLIAAPIVNYGLTAQAMVPS